MIILALDPGPTETAWALISESGQFCGGEKVDNEWLINNLDAFIADQLVIERIRSYGMPAGAELFETCEWSGRFWQRWIGLSLLNGAAWLPRLEVKKNLCHSGSASDPNVRQAIIDRFGGKEKAIGRKGTKKKPGTPGPLYDVSGDVWAAIGVGLTWWDLERMKGVNHGERT